MRGVSEAFLALARQSHQVDSIVEILDASGSVAATLRPISGSVTLDRRAAVRGRVDLKFADDGDQGLIPTSPESPLNVYGAELRVKRGIVIGNEIEYVSLGIFRIDEIGVEDSGGGVTISVSGQDRSSVIIDARLEDVKQIASGLSYAVAIQTLVQEAMPGLTFALQATSFTTNEILLEEGSDRWAAAQEMAASMGSDLFFDGDGVCVLQPIPTPSAVPAMAFSEGSDNVVVTISNNWSRKGHYNRVIASGESASLAVPVRAVVSDDDPASPTYYGGRFGKVPTWYKSPFISTTGQAYAAAAALLQKQIGITQSVSFGLAPNPALEPGDVVAITRERLGIVDEPHLIESITIPLDAGSVMTAETRSRQIGLIE